MTDAASDRPCPRCEGERTLRYKAPGKRPTRITCTLCNGSGTTAAFPPNVIDPDHDQGVGSAGGGREARGGENPRDPVVDPNSEVDRRRWRACFDRTIPLRPPSLNDLNRRYRKMRWAREAVKRDWRPWFKGVPHDSKATGFRLVLFTRFIGPGEREFDDDNFKGGVKAIRDLCREAGLILNDDPKSARFSYRQERAGGPAALRITVLLEDPPVP